MRWIREHKLIASLISLLVVLALIFVLSVVTGVGDNSFAAFVNNGVTKVSGFFSSVGSSVRDGVGGIFSGASKQDKIDELEEEIASLERELAQARLEEGQLAQLQELAGILNYDYTSQVFNVVTADVKLKDGSNWTGIFTIDRGTETGISSGSVVINGAGLVGTVIDAGDGWAKVRPAVSDGDKLSFKLARDGNQLGIVSGNSSGSLSGYMLDDNSTVAEGDILISSGMGSYPEGIEIGSVKSVKYNSDKLMREIIVEPAVSFESLRKVAVII